MPKPTSNDALVQQVKQRRAELIKKHARLAAERITKLKKPTVEQITEAIAAEFEASPV